MVFVSIVFVVSLLYFFEFDLFQFVLFALFQFSNKAAELLAFGGHWKFGKTANILIGKMLVKCICIMIKIL